MRDTWDPATYERFADERRQPFVDLLALVAEVPGGAVVDLGCGAGALTAELHRATSAATTLGIDASAAMLRESSRWAGDGLRFVRGDIERTEAIVRTNLGAQPNVVFANASLQWVNDHPGLLARLVAVLAPGGQLAFQVPANYDHPSHVLAHELAQAPAWRSRFVAGPPESRGDAVLTPEAYATLLDGLGAGELHVRMQVYGHHLPGAASVVEWVQGTLLTPFQAALAPDDYEAFVAEYRRRLLDMLGPSTPYFYPFKRILARARFDG